MSGIWPKENGKEEQVPIKKGVCREGAGQEGRWAGSEARDGAQLG